ncbi:MAG: O-antigen ligase family protein [Paludibacteraceae bacterium]
MQALDTPISQLDTQPKQHHLSIMETVMYVLMFCFLLIAVPQSNQWFIFARLIQGIEVLYFVYLFVISIYKVAKSGSLHINSLHLSIHIWWLFWIVWSFLTSPVLRFTQIFYWVNLCIFLLIFNLYWQKDFKNNLHILAIVFSCLVYTNAILFVLYPEGLWIDEEWTGDGLGSNVRFLFGNYNQTGIVILLALFIQGAYVLSNNRGRWNMILLMFVGIGTVIAMGSMTSAIGISLFAIYYCFRNVVKRPRGLVITFLIIYALCFIGVVWNGHSIEDISFLMNFIENTLHKNATFSNRTNLWAAAVELIKAKPIIGYGDMPIDWMLTNLGGSGPHNLWLMLLLHGGVVLCGLFVWIVFRVFHTLFKCNQPIHYLAAVCICIMLLQSLFEVYTIVILFFILLVAYSCRFWNEPDKVE